MPVIFSLGDFKPSQPCIIHNYIGSAELMQTLLAVIDSKFQDAVCNDDLNSCHEACTQNSACTISADPQAYFMGLHKNENFFFIPLPLLNMTSFLHFGINVFSRITVKGRDISRADYMRVATAAGKLQGVPQDGNVVLQEKFGLFFHPEKARERLNDIIFIRNQLSDQNSRDTLNRFVYCDTLAPLEYFFNTVLHKTQYFDYLRLDNCRVVINCGVDNGWELPFFFTRTDNALRIYNLDPMGDSGLSKYSRTFCLRAEEKFSFHKQAVWSHPTKLHFKDKRTYEVSEGDNSADEVVDAVSIDVFVKQNALEHVDIIKMDLEGAEPHAIRGMMETVKKFRPQLAIAIYHGEDQFLDIPVFVMRQLERYNFYLDTYNHDFGESIFYAIPREIDLHPKECFIVTDGGPGPE